VNKMESSEWSALGSRDIDGQTREGERAAEKESMGYERDGRLRPEGMWSSAAGAAEIQLIARKGLPS
jgi:hypothetical protein